MCHLLNAWAGFVVFVFITCIHIKESKCRDRDLIGKLEGGKSWRVYEQMASWWWTVIVHSSPGPPLLSPAGTYTPSSWPNRYLITSASTCFPLQQNPDGFCSDLWTREIAPQGFNRKKHSTLIECNESHHKLISLSAKILKVISFHFCHCDAVVSCDLPLPTGLKPWQALFGEWTFLLRCEKLDELCLEGLSVCCYTKPPSWCQLSQIISHHWLPEPLKVPRDVGSPWLKGPF